MKMDPGSPGRRTLSKSKSLSSMSSISFLSTEFEDHNTILKSLFNSKLTEKCNSLPDDLDLGPFLFSDNSFKTTMNRRNSFDPSSRDLFQNALKAMEKCTSVSSFRKSHGISRSESVVYKDFTSIGHYRIIKTIGAGAFSTVKLAIDIHSDLKVAIKTIPKSTIERNQFMQISVDNEINLMKVYQNTNL